MAGDARDFRAPMVQTCTGDAPKTWPIRWRLILSATQHNLICRLRLVRGLLTKSAPLAGGDATCARPFQSREEFMFSIAVLSSRGSPLGGMQAEGFATGWAAWTAASKPSRRVSNNRTRMVPHSLKPTRRCRHPEVETDQETEGYLRRAYFWPNWSIGTSPARDSTPMRLSRQLPVSVAAEVRWRANR
jgi:hypothetical protein